MDTEIGTFRTIVLACPPKVGANSSGRHQLGASTIRYMKKNALVYFNHNLFGQTPKAVAKSCLNWTFFMTASIVLLDTQNIEYQDAH